jgi:isopenicillin N synthase-like dioxygenase
MSTRDIPVIDIADLDRAATLDALDAACREWGFFQVVNHGLEDGIVESLRREMRAFFALPGAIKREISRTETNPWGFFDHELTKNTLDWKEIFDYGPADGGEMVPQWPRAMPTFRHAVHAFYGACEALAFRLLAAVSVNLGMPAEHLSRHFENGHTSFLRLNYYPPCPTPERPDGLSTPRHGHLGLNHHTDAGALTLLLQDDQPGLEVYRYGAWRLVEPRRDALVINIGDIVQVWSNDRYIAALHRVIASAGAERFSAPFFFNPSYETDYAPLPTTVGADVPARYRAINWGEFRALRAAGDYADQGEEVQIDHYLSNPEETNHGVHQDHIAG